MTYVDELIKRIFSAKTAYYYKTLFIKIILHVEEKKQIKICYRDKFNPKGR